MVTIGSPHTIGLENCNCYIVIGKVNFNNVTTSLINWPSNGHRHMCNSNQLGKLMIKSLKDLFNT